MHTTTVASPSHKHTSFKIPKVSVDKYCTHRHILIFWGLYSKANRFLILLCKHPMRTSAPPFTRKNSKYVTAYRIGPFGRHLNLSTNRICPCTRYVFYSLIPSSKMCFAETGRMHFITASFT